MCFGVEVGDSDAIPVEIMAIRKTVMRRLDNWYEASSSQKQTRDGGIDWKFRLKRVKEP